MRCVVEAGNQLGESPVWDAAAGLLWWIDIHGRTLHRYAPATHEHRSQALPEQVGSIALRAKGGLVLATRTGFRFHEGQSGELPQPLTGRADLRFNDGRCDRAGRFWAGTVQEKRVLGEAALYRLDRERACEKMLGGITVANGLAWSPDDRTMYLADSHVREIYAFDFDIRKGTLGERRRFARFPEQSGMPDGATVDAEGFLWSAAIGGRRLIRFSPDGRVEREVAMPVTQPTSCTFGGPRLETLFVTSACMRLSPEERARQPLAGHLFAFEPGVRGLEEPRYAG